MIPKTLSPADGAEAAQLSALQKQMLAETGTHTAADVDWQNLIRVGGDHSAPQPITLTFEGDAVLLADNAEFASARRIPGDGEVALYNLIIGKTYHWRACAGDAMSAPVRFTVEAMPPRLILADGLSNVRDIGGRRVPGGVVRQGMVYRGCELEFHHVITEEGIRTLRELGIVTDLDLRREAVGKIDRSALGDDVRYELIPCIAYDKFFEDRETAKKLFDLLADPASYPLYVHCWGGADRTGTLILILCAILGVPERQLWEDYEFTSLGVWGARSIHSDLFQSLLAALASYPGETIRAQCEAFLSSCGVTPEQVARIRGILVEEGC